MGKGLLGPNGRRCVELVEDVVPWREEEVLIANREDCLEACNGVGSKEVKGGGVVLGVRMSCLGEILGEVIRESRGDIIGLDGRAVW
uniref:Uncharacterized protein n=1 Tax=Tanacetum cinerariifolium TaxID=118510 RepID=A0A699H800_TANCI|nr:hypothetical protein [Tanacetum cinerariifolium]